MWDWFVGNSSPMKPSFLLYFIELNYPIHSILHCWLGIHCLWFLLVILHCYDLYSPILHKLHWIPKFPCMIMFYLNCIKTYVYWFGIFKGISIAYDFKTMGIEFKCWMMEFSMIFMRDWLCYFQVWNWWCLMKEWYVIRTILT